jgi:hypothetical protein
LELIVVKEKKGNSVYEGSRGFNRDQECRTEIFFMIVKQELFHFALNATTLLMSRLSPLISFFLFLLVKHVIFAMH